ncbi:MAG: BtpA/SgcQ family protein [Vagococcus sp.]
MINVFEDKKFIIGMVHLDALPGTPLFSGNIDAIYEKALKDARALKKGGITAIMVENAGDTPFPKELDMVQTSCLAAITLAVKHDTRLPVGIDAAFCDYKAALSSAKASGADFVRLAVFVDTVMTASGIIEACSEKAIRYRKEIDAEEIAIYADIQVKYSHMLVKDIPILESAVNAQASLADGIIVTGAYSGNETPIDIVKAVKEKVNIPVIVGSGLDEKNVYEQMSIADGAIVGTSLKSYVGDSLLIDDKKVKALMDNMRGE